MALGVPRRMRHGAGATSGLATVASVALLLLIALVVVRVRRRTARYPGGGEHGHAPGQPAKGHPQPDGKQAPRRDDSHPLPRLTGKRALRIRYLGFLAIAIAAAFLVVGTAAYSLETIDSLVLGVGIGTLAVSLAIAFRFRDLPSLSTALGIAVVSAWAIVSSQLFAPSTVHDLGLAEALAIGGLAIIGLTANQLAVEQQVANTA
jgi:hypothetical protein